MTVIVFACSTVVLHLPKSYSWTDRSQPFTQQLLWYQCARREDVAAGTFVQVRPCSAFTASAVMRHSLYLKKSSCGFLWEIRTRNRRNANAACPTGKQQWGYRSIRFTQLLLARSWSTSWLRAWCAVTLTGEGGVMFWAFLPRASYVHRWSKWKKKQASNTPMFVKKTIFVDNDSTFATLASKVNIAKEIKCFANLHIILFEHSV